MREAKPEWIAALRGLHGCASADIRWNEKVSRWEFIIPGADGVPRSQFWGWFSQPVNVVTGLHPFRELDDDAMREAIGNLEKTFVANRWDGAGSTRKEVARRIEFNAAAMKRKYDDAGWLFADMVQDRARTIRGAPQVVVSDIGFGKGARERATAATP